MLPSIMLKRKGVGQVETALFYWFSWMVWIAVVFFYEDDYWRTRFATGLLIFLMLSERYLSLAETNLSLALVFIWASAILFLFKIKANLWQMSYLVTFGIMLAGIHLFLFINPVWLIFPAQTIVMILFLMLLSVMTRHPWQRMMMYVFVASTGNLLSGYILTSYGLMHSIGHISDLLFLIKGVFLSLVLLALQHLKQKVMKAAYKIKWRTERFGQ